MVSKKVYCQYCRRLVHCRLEEDKEDKITYATCRKCNRRLYQQGVTSWISLKDKKTEVFSEPILSPLMITELAKVAAKSKKKKEL